ncbi:hypothetical protein V8G54_002256 [Vigna mungo]|uniref:Uncharacterized protein n=1 Tax=Vigna mungo TaxID=3915 RepID=A0AAQ3PA23_VIGMU
MERIHSRHFSKECSRDTLWRIMFPLPLSSRLVSPLPYFHENAFLSGVDRAIGVLGVEYVFVHWSVRKRECKYNRLKKGSCKERLREGEVKCLIGSVRGLGDPPLDEVIEKLNSEKAKADDADIEEIDQNDKTKFEAIENISKACATLELKEVAPLIVVCAIRTLQSEIIRIYVLRLCSWMRASVDEISKDVTWVSSMDGTFLRFGELKGAGAMIQQVKEFSYSVSSLLGASPFFPTTYGDVQEKHNESITTSEKSNKSCLVLERRPRGHSLAILQF